MNTIEFLLIFIAIILLWMVGFLQWVFSIIGSTILFLVAIVALVFNTETLTGIAGLLIAIVISGIIISPILLLFNKTMLLKEMKINRPRLHDTLLMISAIIWMLVAVTAYFMKVQ